MKLKYQSEPVEYEVIWNGVKDSPTGGYLSARREDRQPTPPAGTHRDGYATHRDSHMLREAPGRQEKP